MIWSQGEISSAMGSTAAVFLAPGIMGAIAAIFKVSDCLTVKLGLSLLLSDSHSHVHFYTFLDWKS
jgi:hypothetical protein